MKRIHVRCLVDIEQTPKSFHAHAIPEGVEIRPGDTVLVHGAPAQVDFGDSVRVECSATVTRANVLGRFWTHMTAWLGLIALFEVGFQPKGSP